jgi:anthranilate phosphoribosyltransferase
MITPLSTSHALAYLNTALDVTAPTSAIVDALHALHPNALDETTLGACWQVLWETKVPLPAAFRTASTQLDCCGTGGSGQGHFNVSTTVAFVLAAAGLPVVKFGNRSATGQVGSSDLLGQLGLLPAGQTLETIATGFSQTGLAFLHAPLVYPNLAHLGPLRKALGHPTVFNVLGPLLNPVGPTHRLLGVYNAPLAKRIASGLALGCFGPIERAWVVTGPTGEDELGLHTDLPNHMWEVCHGQANPLQQATGLVFPPPQLALTPTSPLSNADVFLALLRGDNTDTLAYWQVCLNAAAGLCVAGLCDTLLEGLQDAKALLASGAPMDQFKRLQEALQPRG